ncbi:MAG: asparagine synthase-related protein [Moheibacter sp.]
MKVDFQIVFDRDKNVEVFLKKENARPHDFIFYEDDEFQLFIKGIVLNEKDLMNQYGVSNQIFKTIYEQRGIRFSDSLTGEFCGFVWDKKQQQILVFTNLIASQRVFYYQNQGNIVIGTNLFDLKKYLDESQLPYSEDLNSAYSMLVLSSLMDNNTLISEVKKLRSSEQILIDTNSGNLKIERLTPLENRSVFQGTKAAALSAMDELFSIAVRQEYEKDLDIGKKHFSLLSGGLDSRLGIFYAKKLGFKPEEALCFSHSGYWDEKIARKIAKDQELNLNVIHLDGGEYLKDIDEISRISQGLTQFTGGVHSNFALEQIDFSDLGVIHSGHLGDAVLGTYLSVPERTSPENALRKIISNSTYQSKIDEYLKQLLKNYDSEEMCLLHNRGFNYIVIGNYVAEKFSWQLSPFMHNDFLRFVLTLPEEWKFNQKIYIEWINKYCKPSTAYKWERTLMRPDKKWKTAFGSDVLSRANNIFYNKFLGKPYKAQMTSYAYYYQYNASVQQYFEEYFSKHIDLLKNQELKKDATEMFQRGGFKEKSMVLSLLGAYKQIFG